MSTIVVDKDCGLTPAYYLKGSDIALVGNSPDITGSKHGDLINSFPEVFRFNGAPTAGYENDVGNKTTGMILGIDVGQISCPPYRLPEPGNLEATRLSNACTMLELYNCPFFVFSYDALNEKNGQDYRNAHKYLSDAAVKSGRTVEFHFFSDDPVLGLGNFYVANIILEKLGCKSRLTKGGPRSGFRMVLRLLLANATPHIFGFNIDPSSQVVSHYHNSFTINAGEHDPHDVIGEAVALSEMAQTGLIVVHV